MPKPHRKETGVRGEDVQASPDFRLEESAYNLRKRLTDPAIGEDPEAYSALLQTFLDANGLEWPMGFSGLTYDRLVAGGHLLATVIERGGYILSNVRLWNYCEEIDTGRV